MVRTFRNEAKHSPQWHFWSPRSPAVVEEGYCFEVPLYLPPWLPTVKGLNSHFLQFYPRPTTNLALIDAALLVSLFPCPSFTLFRCAPFHGRNLLSNAIKHHQGASFIFTYILIKKGAIAASSPVEQQTRTVEVIH